MELTRFRAPVLFRKTFPRVALALKVPPAVRNLDKELVPIFPAVDVSVRSGVVIMALILLLTMSVTAVKLTLVVPEMLPARAKPPVPDSRITTGAVMVPASVFEIEFVASKSKVVPAPLAASMVTPAIAVLLINTPPTVALALKLATLVMKRLRALVPMLPAVEVRLKD